MLIDGHDSNGWWKWFHFNSGLFNRIYNSSKLDRWMGLDPNKDARKLVLERANDIQTSASGNFVIKNELTIFELAGDTSPPTNWSLLRSYLLLCWLKSSKWERERRAACASPETNFTLCVCRAHSLSCLSRSLFSFVRSYCIKSMRFHILLIKSNTHTNTFPAPANSHLCTRARAQNEENERELPMKSNSIQIESRRLLWSTEWVERDVFRTKTFSVCYSNRLVNAIHSLLVVAEIVFDVLRSLFDCLHTFYFQFIFFISSALSGSSIFTACVWILSSMPFVSSQRLDDNVQFVASFVCLMPFLATNNGHAHSYVVPTARFCLRLSSPFSPFTVRALNKFSFLSHKC